MPDIKSVIQSMVDAGEPEEKILELINLYNEEKSEKANGSANATPIGESTAMESESDDGSSDSPSWGDRLKNALDFKIDYSKVKPKDRIGFDPKSSITPDIYTKQKQEEELKAERQSDPKWKKQKEELSNELEKAFGEDAKLFEKMIKNPSDLSLQERKATAGMFGKPEEYLLDIVKKELGGFGLFSDRRTPEGFRSAKTGEIIGTKGEVYYPNLTNADIENIVSDKFYDKLALEKINKGNELAEGIKNIVDAEGGEGVRKYQDRIRNVFVDSYVGIPSDIAQSVERLNHGEFPYTNQEGESVSREDEYTNLLKLKKDNKTSMLYDLNTRQLVIARDKKDANDKKGKNKNLVDLGVGDKQAEWNDKLGRLKPEDQLDYLANEFERSALTYAGHRKQINEKQNWSIRRSSYEMTADPEGGNRKVVFTNLKDLMLDTEFADFAPVPADELRQKKGESDKDYKKRKDTLINTWEGNIAGLKQDDLEYTRDFEALKGMYLLNQGIVDIEKPKYIGIIPRNYSALKQSTAALIKPWTSEYYAERLMGATDRTMLTTTGEVYDNLGIEKTAAEEKQLKTSLAEDVNEGVLGMNKMLFEFQGYNKFMSVFGAEAALGNLINRLQKGTKFVRNGKTYTEAVINARAAKQFPKLKQAAATKEYLRINKGLRRFSSVKDKGTAILASALTEGVKFEAFTQFDITKGKLKPEAGEQFGFWTGFGFGGMSRIIAPLSPLLQKKGYLTDIDRRISLGSKQARIGLNGRKLFETFVTQPASFVAGSEAGEYIHALADDALGNADYSNYMKDKYGDYGKVGRHLITQYFVGLGLTTGHFKGFSDFKSKAALKRVQTTAYEQMQEKAKKVSYAKGITSEKLTESELNNMFREDVQGKLHEHLSDKDLQEFYKHWEVYDGTAARLQNLYRAEGYMDPDRADEQVRQEHKDLIERERKAGRTIKIEVVNNKDLRFGQQGIDPKRNAEISTDPVSKITTIKYNAERYTPDVMTHEVHHYFTEKLLGEDVMFNTDFMGDVGNIAGKIKLKRLITEEQAKELGDEGLQGKKMTLAQSIKLKKFDVKDPVNNQRIRQWELFGHISQEIGNKNNYFDIKEADGFLGLKNLLKPLVNSSGKKVNLSTEADVVRWFRDYARHTKKGNYSEVVKLFDELKSVIDNNTEIKKEVAKQEGRTGRDTYSSEILDLGDGRKVNDPKKLANDVQKEYEAKLAEGKSKMEVYRELSDPNQTSPNYSKDYPILGKKLGPMLDVAISSWNRAVEAPGDPFKIDLRNRSWDSKRSSLALDFRADKRGFEDIFDKYEPINKETGKPQKLMTWVVGQSRLRMQEVIDRGVGKETDIRETKVGEWTEFERIFEDVDVAGGKVDKSFDAQNPNIERKGIYLPDFKFEFEGGQKRTINPASVENIKAESKKVFYESKLEENTGVKIGEKLKPITETAMNEMIGVKEGMKPKEIDNIQTQFFARNKAISYDAGLELTSNPNFYENTNAAKSIFKFAHKNTGVKYKTAELTVEEARRTDARTYKYEKKKATEQLVDKVQEVINSGRDAGTRVAKQNVLKNGIGKHFGNQIYRESLKEIKQEIDSKLQDPTSDVKYWSEQKAKLEGVMAELAMRKLRGATPEKLASEDLDVMNNFIKEWKGLDHGKLKYPEIRLRTMIENNKDYKRLFDTKLNVVDQIAKEMGYELREISKDVFEQVSEANRVLEKNITKIVEPRLTKNWKEVEFGNEMKQFLKEKGYPKEIVNELKFDETSWSKDRNSVIEYDTFLKDFYNELPLEIALHQILKKSAGTGAGKTLFANEKGQVERRNNDWWDSFSKKFKGSGKKAPTWLKHVKTIKNDVLKSNINKALELPEFSDIKTNEKTQKKFANYITKKYLTGKYKDSKGKTKQSSYEQVLNANQKMMEFMGEKLFDYFNKSKDKIFALNNIKRYLQIQTSIEDGFVRSLATHDAISIKRGSKHSEHEFQALNMSTNLMLNIVKNSGSKKVFLENLKPLTRIFRQSIIEKSVQAKYDAPEFGGRTGFEFVFTTETGKYAWMREMQIAETTLDLRTGKTYDKLILDLVTSSKALKAVEKLKDKMLKQVSIDSKKMSPTEKVEVMKTVDKALELGRKRKKKSRGMSTFDFDETVGISENYIFATKGKEKKKIASNEWPFVGEQLRSEGWKFDFTDFNRVTKGKPGPLMQKLKNQIDKFGNENVFILTARAKESAPAIHEWLKSEGVNIPLKNITGLGNSTGEAKAMWMLEKFSEGYNDMYFVDDALPNVKAVKNVLSQLDIKSNVQMVNMVKTGRYLLDTSTKEGREILDQMRSIKTVSSSEFKKAGRWTLDTSTKEGKEIAKQMDNIKTVSSSEFKKMGNWILDTKTPEGKKILEEFEKIKTVSSSEFGKLASENLDININKIMEHSLDIESKKIFSKAEAKVRGKDIKRRRFFISDSAADLELLIEPLYGKGKKGIKNKKWFDKEFINPFERGIRDYNTARQTAKNDYIGLRKQNKDIVKKLNKPVEGTTFTHDMAMRVYLWNKAGYKIPDLAKTTETKLVEHIRNNPELQAYAETFARITKIEKGLKEPSAEWWGETMAGEVSNIGRGVSRKQYLKEWVDVKNEIFSPENMNKMESKLGTRWRENIEDMFDRMETGRTRSLKLDRGSAMMMDYLNGSVGTIMNFNTRSAALQTISTINFLNMRENNPIAAAKAMGNAKQFSKDFLKIMNSDMLKQRRDGLEINVTEAELASAAATSKNPINAMIAKVLKVGYLPTKLADSFAISFGGATYYRNRIKMYEKQGLSSKEAEGKAWTDFQKLSERTQQSSRPDLLSRQQTSLAGRIILPFANTPLQMNRRGMKDILDISKGRYKDKVELTEKMGRISYYMGAQVAIFAGLQSALFAMLLNEEDVSSDKIAKTKTYTLSTISDSFLRGMGIQGAVLSGFKNAIMAYAKENEKGFTADYSEVGEALLNISPPVGSKFGKLDAAGNIMKWAKIKKEDEFKFELGNPSLEAGLLTVEALTNIPLHRAHKKSSNIKHSLNTDYENWQRAHMIGGWTPWNVGIESDSKKKKQKFGTGKKLKTRELKTRELKTR